MSKKITKTIALIVFLVIIGFSGVNKVSAVDDTDVVCYYGSNIKVKIKTKGQTEISAKVGSTTAAIRNWKSSIGGFKGYDYFYVDNEYVCPPSIFYLDHNDYDYGNTFLDYLYFYSGTASKSSYESDATTEFKKVDGSKHDVKCGVEEKKMLGGIKYKTTCTQYNLTKQEGPEADPAAPDPTPSLSECEENPEACKDPEVNSNVVKPISPDSTAVYSCGDGMMVGLNANIIKVTNYAYNILRIIVPLALIILGSIDLIKGIMAQKEDEIKKGQQTFIKRLITAVLIFFVFAIVKFLLGVFASSKSADIIECLNCLIDGTESTSCVQESEW